MIIYYFFKKNNLIRVIKTLFLTNAILQFDNYIHYRVFLTKVIDKE